MENSCAATGPKYIEDGIPEWSFSVEAFKSYRTNPNGQTHKQTRPNALPRRIKLKELLTPSATAVPNCWCSKGSVPYWSNPPFLIFDIRALWRSGLSARAPECQKLKMTG